MFALISIYSNVSLTLRTMATMTRCRVFFPLFPVSPLGLPPTKRQDVRLCGGPGSPQASLIGAW